MAVPHRHCGLDPQSPRLMTGMEKQMHNWEVLFENNHEEAQTHPVYEQTAKQAILAALEAEGMTKACPGEISLLFVGHDEMQTLNKEYRGLDKPTDCLSFPQFTPEELAGQVIGFAALGDIVINIDAARAQAMEYGHSIQREISFLAVHSLLHLLGYDHEDKQAENEMFARQEAILTKMGLKRGV